MHRPAWIRALTLLWGVWITTALTEPAAILPCAMHGGVPADARAEEPHATPGSHAGHTSRHASPTGVARAPDGSHESGGPSATHGAAGAGATRGNAPSKDAPAHDCCTCLGQCCAAAPVAAPAVVEVAIAAMEARIEPAAPVVRRAESPAWRDHSLPFANGPPAFA